MTDKRSKPMRVCEALESYLRRTGLDERLDEAGAIPDWDQRVGERIADVTRPIAVSGGVLIVGVRSHAWLMELKLIEHEILRRLNAGRKHGKIDKIRFVIDREPRAGAGTTGG